MATKVEKIGKLDNSVSSSQEEGYENFLSLIDNIIEKETLEKDSEYQKQKLKDKILNKHLTANGIVSSFRFKEKREKVKNLRKVQDEMKKNELEFFERNKVLNELTEKYRKLHEEMLEAKEDYEESKENLQMSQKNDDLYSFERKELMEYYDHYKENFEELKAKCLELNDKMVGMQSKVDHLRYRVEDKKHVDQNFYKKEKKRKKVLTTISKYRENDNVKNRKRKDKQIRKKKKELDVVVKKHKMKLKTMKDDSRRVRKKNRERMKPIEKRWKEERLKKEKDIEDREIRIKKSQKKMLESIEKERNRIRGIVDRIQKKKKKILDNERHETIRIQAEGGNPYELGRLRKRNELVVKRNNQYIKKRKSNNRRIKKDLRKEFVTLIEKKERERKEIEVVDKWREELGIAAELKDKNYIKSRTMDGSEVVDPLNKEARLYPSKFMMVKDWKFGLGRTTTDNPFMNKMKKKYKNAQVDYSFIPKMRKARKEKEKKKKLKDDGESSDEEYMMNEFKGMWSI